MKQVGADDATIEAVRNNTEIPDEKLEALHRFATKMVETRGHVGDDELQRVMEAGYSHRQVLEVVVGLSFKVLSNYTNSLVKTPPRSISTGPDSREPTFTRSLLDPRRRAAADLVERTRWPSWSGSRPSSTPAAASGA